MRELMTTREVAEYLRIKERKVYALVQGRAIPCTRVTGKWLFPRAMIDLWVLQNTEYVGRVIAPAAPPVLAGSHDPLLEWAVRESGCGLAVLFDGSLDGIQRVTTRQACACGVHVIDPGDESYNVHLLDRQPAMPDAVLLQWAWREQGFILAAGNPLGISSLADVAAHGVRMIDRQQSAGSHLLLEHLLQKSGLPPDAIKRVPRPARNESDAAFAVANGDADVALGIAAVARQYRLGFVPVQSERYDLLCRRRDYFEPPLQALLTFARSASFSEQARLLGGYDIDGLGRVMYNAA